MRLCRTCRFWDKPNQYQVHGTCARIRHLNAEDIGDDSSAVEDGSGYYAALRCREDFGCTLHEKNESPITKMDYYPNEY